MLLFLFFLVLVLDELEEEDPPERNTTESPDADSQAEEKDLGAHFDSVEEDNLDEDSEED